MTLVLAWFGEHAWQAYVLTGIVGAIIGSFINMLAYRLPQMIEQETLLDAQHVLSQLDDTSPKLDAYLATKNQALSLSQASHCPCCQHKLTYWQNIPLLSYVVLRGKCAYCSAVISSRYLLTEILATCAPLALLYLFGPNSQFITYSVFIWFGLCLANIDAQTYLLPDKLTLPLLWLGLIAAYFGWIALPLENAIMGAIIGYMSLYLVFWLIRLLTGKEGFGFGDFKLLAAIGAWLGVSELLGVIIIASLSALMLSMVTRGFQLGASLPFGPYLVFGAIIMLLGTPICQLLGLPDYLNLLRLHVNL